MNCKTENAFGFGARENGMGASAEVGGDEIEEGAEKRETMRAIQELSFKSYLVDPRSASGSFQNEGLLSGGDVADAEFGFSRPDFRQSSLVGTVELYERHVFLCYKNPRFWPPRIEAAEFDRLPRLLYAAVKARKNHMKKEVVV
ncbi:hypothetical protein RYX36_005461 [Vicia faba]